MRTLEFLSPTAIDKFQKDPKTFYKEYLADTRMERLKQTEAMSVGSAFDAFVKHSLVKALFGKADGRFDLGELFTSQVESHNRTFAWIEGRAAYEAYVNSGAFARLLLLLERSVAPPRFEFTGQAVVRGVPLLGKPDLAFDDSDGNRVILDWKVNGWVSASGVSPNPGYMECLDADGGYGGAHKNFVLARTSGGVPYCAVSELDEKWDRQLSIYHMVVAEESGHNGGGLCLGAIDQITKRSGKVRVALHRVQLRNLEKWWAEANNVWEIIKSGWIFRDMSEEQSWELQAVYDQGAVRDSDFDELCGGAHW